MALKLKGSTSGFVAVDCAAEGGNNTLILPDNNGVAGAIWANNVDTAGVATCTSVTINKNGDLTVPGTVSVGGTLTYEDVTNVDVVGLVTAAQGVRINGGGLSIIGVTTGFNSSGVSTFNDDVTFTGAAANVTWDKSTDDLIFNDNAQAKFGTGGDLSIYHDSNHSYIKDGGTGNLYVDTNSFIVRNAAGNETLMQMSQDDAVYLYHNNSQKFQTTTSGISITNELNVAGISTFGNDLYIADTIAHTGDLNTKIRFPAADTITAETGGSERIRIDSSGRVLVGATANNDVGGFGGSAVQIEGLNAPTSSMSLLRHSNDTAGSTILMGKSRGTSDAATTIVQSGDSVARIIAYGADGTDVATPVGGIQFDVDGTPGANDMPGRIVFKTTADGANDYTERVRIDSTGRIIQYGSAGIADAGSDDLVIGDTTGSVNRGMTIYSHNAQNGSIAFADNDNNFRGALQYMHNGDRFRILTGGQETFRVQSGGTDGVCTFFMGGTTNNQNKNGALTLNHYTFNTYNQIDLIRGTSTSGVNKIEIGGSDSSNGSSAATSIQLYTAANATTNNGSLRLNVDATGRVSINGAGTKGMLEVRASGGDPAQLTAVFGANEGTTAGTLTDNTDKACRIGIQNYDTDAKPFSLVTGSSTNGVNNLCFGGGTSLMNGATEIKFATDAGQTNNGGTEKMRITSEGRFQYYTQSGQFTNFRESFKSGALSNSGTFTAQTHNCHACGTVTITSNLDGSSNNKRCRQYPISLNSTSNANLGSALFTIDGSSGQDFSVAGTSKGIIVTNTSGNTVYITVTFDITGSV